MMPRKTHEASVFGIIFLKILFVENSEMKLIPNKQTVSGKVTDFRRIPHCVQTLFRYFLNFQRLPSFP